MMEEFACQTGRQHLESTPPFAYLHTSAKALWANAFLTHTRTSKVGRFQGCWSTLVVSVGLNASLEVIEFDRAGNKVVTTARTRIILPNELDSLGWERSQEAVSLFVGVPAIERILGVPYAPTRIARCAAGRDTDRVLEHLMRALLADVVGGCLGGPVLGETIVAAIVNHLQTGPDPAKPGRASGLTRRQFAIARDLIHANLARRLQIAEVAEALDMSVRHLCRAFRASTGHTPYGYILQCRLDLAKSLIEDGKMSLEVVAETAGFADRNHMTATFRKVLDVTPTQFRRVGGPV